MKMDMFTRFIVAVAVSYLSTECLGDVSFRTSYSTYQSRNHYYVNQYQAVSLLCSNTPNPVSIYKTGIHEDEASVMVRQGEQIADRQKYIFETNSRGYNLTILNTALEDSAIYTCAFVGDAAYDNNDLCSSFIYLHVLDQQPSIFCDLVSGTNGVFFVGDTIIVICRLNEYNAIVRVYLENDSGFLQGIPMPCVPGERSVYPYCNITIKDVSKQYNGTTIRCMQGQLDFCRFLPRVRVYNYLTTTMSPKDAVVTTNGEEVTFTCRTIPSLISNVTWAVEDNDDVEFVVKFTEQTSVTEISIGNIRVRNGASGKIGLTCTVSIGWRSNKSLSSISYTSNTMVPDSEEATTAFSTHGFPESLPSSSSKHDVSDGSTGKPNSSELSVGTTRSPVSVTTIAHMILRPQATQMQNQNNSVPLADRATATFPVTPMAVSLSVIGILFIVVVAIIYCVVMSKRRLTPISNTPHSTGHGQDGSDRHINDNVYHIDDKVAMGLSVSNSEVVGNVIYEPYNGDDNRVTFDM